MMSNNRTRLTALVLFLGISLSGIRAFAQVPPQNPNCPPPQLGVSEPELCILSTNFVAPNNIAVPVLDVPAGQTFVLHSVVIATQNPVAVCCQVVLGQGQPVTGNVSVQARDSVQITFDPPIDYQGPETVAIRNGAVVVPPALSTATNWTLIGERAFVTF